MNMDYFENLLREFGSNIGMHNLSFEQDDLCYLTINQTHPIIIRRDYSRECLVLIGPVAVSLPEQINRSLWIEMISMGLTPLRDNAPGLGFDAESGHVLIHQSIPLRELNAHQLSKAFDGFLLAQISWSKKLETGSNSNSKDRKNLEFHEII
jgi:hypothetical protein